MTGRERILNTLRGKPTDRVPVWLGDHFAKKRPYDPYREPYRLSGHWPYAMARSSFYDPYTEGFKTDPVFTEIRDYYYEQCEIMQIWPVPGMNRILVIPERNIVFKEEKYHEGYRDRYHEIVTPKGNLTYMYRPVSYTHLTLPTN